jgi:transcriptional regulator with XRE-family HTH domain
MFSMERFSDWLLRELKDRDMSQSDLSTVAGLGRGTISNIMNGTRNVGQETLVKIASALHLPPDLVFEKAGILPPKPGNLSEEQQQVIHLVTQVDDNKTLRMISAMLEQALDEKSREKNPRR